jgi:adhesin transport system outer membrane protein
MTLAENNYVEHRAVFEQLKQRTASGAGRRVDLEHAESRLALADINLTTEQANLHDVTARYMRIVNEPPAAAIAALTGHDKGYPDTVKAALELSFKHNPTLRAAVENIEAAQYDLDARRGAYHPRLDFRVRSEHNENYQGTPGTRSQQVAELILNYNIFNGGSDVARTRQYAERRSQAIDLRDKACRDIRQTLVIAYNDVRRLKSQLVFLGIQVKAVEKTREAYRAQFNIGQRSLLDMLDTENEVLNARRAEVNAEIDYSFAYLRTYAGMGRLLSEFGLKHTERDNLPTEDDFSIVPLAEICGAQAPSVIEIDNTALTARALQQLEKLKPAAKPVVVGVAGAGAVVAAPVNSVSAAQAAEQSLRDRLTAWAAAWSARDINAYLAFYGNGFTPEKGGSRDAWKAQRQARLTRPGQIKLELSELQTTVNGESADTMFLQKYVSDVYSDTSRKTLKWVREAGEWVIRQELATKQ